MKRVLSFLALLLICSWGWSASFRNFQTDPVAEEDGDTITTFSITLDSYTWKLIDSSNVVNGVGEVQRTIRKRTIRNNNAFTVYISSSQFTNALPTMGYQLDQTTSTQPSYYTTYNTATLYGACSGPNATCTVNVIKETNSIP